MADCFWAFLNKQLQNLHFFPIILVFAIAEIMKGHPTVIVFTANRIRSCIDEELNNVGCHIRVATCVMEWQLPIMISSPDRVRKIFEKISNYALGDSFMIASLKEELIIIHTMMMRRQLVSLNYLS